MFIKKLVKSVSKSEWIYSLADMLTIIYSKGANRHLLYKYSQLSLEKVCVYCTNFVTNKTYGVTKNVQLHNCILYSIVQRS